MKATRFAPLAAVLTEHRRYSLAFGNHKGKPAPRLIKSKLNLCKSKSSRSPYEYFNP